MSSAKVDTTRHGVRSAVRKTPGPCAHWNDQEADLTRDILDMVGDKWSVLIIGTLADGPLRYSDLVAAVPAVTQRMLTLTLKHLRRNGLVDRTSHPEVPPRVEYALTPLGASLLDTVLALAAWSAGHQTEIRGRREEFDGSGHR